MQKKLVVLPGWAHTRFSYRKFIKAAPDGWSVEIIDYAKLFRKYTHKDDVREKIAKHLQQYDHPYYLFAHSLGGSLAIDACAKTDLPINHLFLCDTEGIYEKESLIKELRKTLIYPKGHALVNRLYQAQSITYMLKNPKLHYKLAQHARMANLEKEATQISLPTTIFWGELDKLTPLHQGEKLHSLMPTAEFQIIPHATHAWHLFMPEKFWTTIQRLTT